MILREGTVFYAFLYFFQFIYAMLSTWLYAKLKSKFIILNNFQYLFFISFNQHYSSLWFNSAKIILFSILIFPNSFTLKSNSTNKENFSQRKQLQENFIEPSIYCLETDTKIACSNILLNWFFSFLVSKKNEKSIEL